MKNYKWSMNKGISASPKFAEKKLAEFAVNVGVRCGHDCTYCSSRAMLRMHPAFKKHKRKPFRTGYSIVDSGIAEKVAKDAKGHGKRGLVQLCTAMDAWSPEAQAHDLGRRCLQAILAEPDWTVRILTKNAAVVRDFDIIRKYKDRVLVGLSLTGTPDRQDVLSVIEPYASPISERLAAMKKRTNWGCGPTGCCARCCRGSLTHRSKWTSWCDMSPCVVRKRSSARR